MPIGFTRRAMSIKDWRKFRNKRYLNFLAEDAKKIEGSCIAPFAKSSIFFWQDFPDVPFLYYRIPTTEGICWILNIETLNKWRLELEIEPKTIIWD